MPDRVLLTGISGFLGGHIALQLLAAGYTVRGSVRNLARADKVREMLANARNEAERITREAYTQRATEEAKLLEAKRESTQYIENMRLLCSKQLDFLDSLQSMKLEDLARPSSTSQTVDETVRSIENSVESFSDAGDADEEIRRVVTNKAESPANSAEEPTRLFSASSANAQGGQFSFENLRFGK